MFRFLELELHGWDLWRAFRVPMDADVVVLSGPNGSGKTTVLDAIRQILNAPTLSQKRKLSHYLRTPNQPALLRAVVTNTANARGRRPFERQKILTDEVTLACGLVTASGPPEKRFAVLPGRVGPRDLQAYLLETRDWLGPEAYQRVLEYAGVSRSLMHILALEQGRADDLASRKPNDLFRWVLEARGSQQVLERYGAARRQFIDSMAEVTRQSEAVIRHERELASLRRRVGLLDEFDAKVQRAALAEQLVIAARYQATLHRRGEIAEKLPELRTRVTNLTSTAERMRREVAEGEAKLVGLQEEQTRSAEHAVAARDAFDKVNARHAVVQTRVDRLVQLRAELATSPIEDVDALRRALDAARREQGDARRAEQEVVERSAQLAAVIADLERGQVQYPAAVRGTLAALRDEGINATLVAPHVEVTDPAWTEAIESALGDARFALAIRPADEERACAVARSHGFPGPLVTDTTVAPVEAGALALGTGVPVWLARWASAVVLSEECHPPSDALALTRAGVRRDERGVWANRVDQPALGGSAVARQLESAREELARVEERRQEHAQRCAAAEIECQDLEERLRVQLERGLKTAEAESLLAFEAELVTLAADLAGARTARDAAQRAADAALAASTAAEPTLAAQRAEAEGKQKEADGMREACGKIERELSDLEPTLGDLERRVSPEHHAAAVAGELPSETIAQHDAVTAHRAVEDMRTAGLPEPIVREEYQMAMRNTDELQAHVQRRQAEAEKARAELDHCRGDYLGVVKSTLDDYAKRARALAALAEATIEVDWTELANDDKVLDHAGITVRIGFDGKPPTALSDTAHSGGQQVIAGLVLLMAMAEVEGDAFFIVDEPFAHLSMDRVDDVGRFLRNTGAQFVITVPTTLDRGQLDPASLLIAVRKKVAGERFAVSPLVARR